MVLPARRDVGSRLLCRHLPVAHPQEGLGQPAPNHRHVCAPADSRDVLQTLSSVVRRRKTDRPFPQLHRHTHTRHLPPALPPSAQDAAGGRMAECQSAQLPALHRAFRERRTRRDCLLPVGKPIASREPLPPTVSVWEKTNQDRICPDSPALLLHPFCFSQEEREAPHRPYRDKLRQYPCSPFRRYAAAQQELPQACPRRLL